MILTINLMNVETIDLENLAKTTFKVGDFVHMALSSRKGFEICNKACNTQCFKG